MRAATSYAISVHWLLLRPVLVRSKCLSEAVIVSILFRGKLWSSSLPSSVFLRFKDFASFKTHLSVRYLCCHQETQRQRESMKRISTISLKAQSCHEPATSENTRMHLNHFVCVGGLEVINEERGMQLCGRNSSRSSWPFSLQSLDWKNDSKNKIIITKKTMKRNRIHREQEQEINPEQNQ